MKRFLLFLPSLLTLSIVTSFSGARAGTISITSPAPNSTLNCIVTVTVSVTAATGESKLGNPILQITDNLHHQSTVQMNDNGGTAGGFDTIQVPNGTVSLCAHTTFMVNGQPQTVYSPTIDVTVKNGFILNTDAAKTYAKVTLPTAGQSIVANGQSFAVTSDHQITWTRYDNCESFSQSYVFKLTCTYPNVSDVVYSGQYPLPQQIGDCQVTKTLGIGNTYLSGGPTPVTYYVYAFCYTPDQNTQVAQGSSTFTMVPIPKQ